MSIEQISEESGAPDLRRTRRRNAPVIDPSKLDRLPPHAAESEQGILGCCLWAPDTAIDETVLAIGTHEVFYDLRHQAIFQTMVAMREAMEPVTIISLQQRLKERRQLDQIGGILYLSSLQDAVPSSANLGYYTGVVKEKWLLRKQIRLCVDFVGQAYEQEQEAVRLMDELERNIMACRHTFERSERVDVKAVQKRLVQMYDRATSGMVVGLQTEFRDLDHKLGGMMPQEMIVIGGTPSSGKTTLALNIAYSVAERGTVVSIKSLETSADKVVHRLHCIAGRVDSSGFLRGNPSERDMVKMIAAVDRVAKQNDRLMVDDRTMTDSELMASCRKDYQNGARLFVVDMLQNIQARGDGDFAVVTAASKCVKNIAKELDVPVIVVSSLSRMDTDKSGKVRRPTMHDLRQSGQIEFDADKIILLHCAERDADIRQVDAIIEKNKDGPLGEVPFTFFANQFRFETASLADEPEARPREPHND